MDRFSVNAVLFCSFLVFPASQQDRESEKPTLLKVLPKSGSPIVGQLIDESNGDLKLLDLRTGKPVTLSRQEILRVTKNISDKEVVSSVGLPAFVAWRIGGILDASPKSGKVVRVAGTAVYASFGAKTGTTKGQKLVVFRDQGEVKDPDTGRVLGKDLAEIARLEVTEVQADFCKTKVIGELKVEVAIGDLVQLDGLAGLLAILPLVDADGDETEGGRKLAEELTTVLVSRGVRSVERTLLEKALRELSVQQSDLFDPKAAQQVGKQIGAFAVVCGTIVYDAPTGSEGRSTTASVRVEEKKKAGQQSTTANLRADEKTTKPERRGATAFVRVIKVETGEILVAASQAIAGRDAKLDKHIYPSSVPISPRPKEGPGQAGESVRPSAPRTASNRKAAFSTLKTSASVAAKAASDNENKEGRIRFVADPENAWALFQKVGAGKGNNGSYEPAPADAIDASFVGFVPDAIFPGFGFGRADEDTIRIFRTTVHADTKITVAVQVGGDDCAALYVNGSRVAFAKLQNISTNITLNTGRNVIEVANYNGAGGALVGFSQADHVPVGKLPGLRLIAEE